MSQSTLVGRLTASAATAAVGFVALCLSLTPLVTRAQAQYPAKPIKIIVPFTAGTGIDALARQLGDRLSARLKTPVLIENRDGAGGTIGATAVMRAPPDGYTLLLAANPPFAVGAVVQKNNAYRAVEDFAPVARVATTAMLLVASPKAPFQDFEGMAAHVRSNPGKVDFATVGVGTPSHLGVGVLERNLGAKLQPVHYKSSSQAHLDTISGQVLLAMPSLPAAMGQVQAHKLIPLAIGSAQRSPLLPRVPTFSEALGKKDVEATVWYGMFAPRGTDSRIIAILGNAIRDSLPSMKAFLLESGMEPTYEVAAAFGKKVQDDVSSGTTLLKELGISE